MTKSKRTRKKKSKKKLSPRGRRWATAAGTAAGVLLCGFLAATVPGGHPAVTSDGPAGCVVLEVSP
jgi:hypothetical protein